MNKSTVLAGALFSAALFAVPNTSVAQTVNWLDPLPYAKPAPVQINKPNEATVTNKYWVDLSSGSGTSCTQSGPCRSFDDLIGKPGTQGGPAIIYVKGTGGHSWFQDTIYGAGDSDCRSSSCSNWILIRTWPAGSPGCASECTATINGNSNMNSANVHHIMWDGGPDLKIRFNSNAGAGTYAHNINSDWHVVYRTQQYCSGTGGKQLGWQIGSTAVADSVYFINNEFYGCDATGDQSSAVYVGPGNGGGYTNFVFQNNIVRDFFGEGIEVNPRVTSSGLTIIGNAIHNVGKGTCSSSWLCRPAITVSIQSGGGNHSTLIANNLMWDIGSGCVWNRGGGNPTAVIVNNTCYDYGKGSGGGGPNPQGISGYSGSGTATVRNNIFYAPNGTNPFDSSNFTASNNVCASSETCGTSKQTWSASTVVSTSQDSAGFMQPSSSSEARNTGYVMSSVTSVYAGGTRPQESAYDIGAFEYGATGGGSTPPVPAAPTNVKITP